PRSTPQRSRTRPPSDSSNWLAASPCAFHLFARWLTPLAGGIRDGARPRGAPPPHCPGRDGRVFRKDRVGPDVAGAAPTPGEILRRSGQRPPVARAAERDRRRESSALACLRSVS